MPCDRTGKVSISKRNSERSNSFKMHSLCVLDFYHTFPLYIVLLYSSHFCLQSMRSDHYLQQ